MKENKRAIQYKRRAYSLWNCTNEYLSKNKGYHQNWLYQI